MQLKHIDLIDEPMRGLIIAEMCLILIIFYFITLTSLIKKIGKLL